MLAVETHVDDRLFGAVIKQGRERHRLTQERLAELIDVDTRTVQRWEAGECIPWPLYIESIISTMPEIEASLREAIKKNTTLIFLIFKRKK